MDNHHLIIDTPAIRELTVKEVKFQIFTHSGEVFSLEQAARERGQRPEQVVRSILFRIGNNEFVMVLVAGPSQISWSRLREYLSISRMTMATKEEVFTWTGYQSGAVTPFGLSLPIRILVDERVFFEAEVSIGSGKRNTTIVISTAELRRALGDIEIACFIEC